MTDTKKQVVIVHPSITEDINGDIIIRGVLSNESLRLLKVDAYQREQLTSKKIADLADAIAKDTVPDIELSWRGKEDFDLNEDGSVVLTGGVFIVDGQQRRAGAVKALADGHNPRLGATVYLGKDKAWEKDRFLTLNLTQTRVGPNVILRNLVEDHPGLKAIYWASQNDNNFILKNKVSWSQYMAKNQLIKASSLVGVAVQLHRHIINGELVSNSSGAKNLANNMDKIFAATGQSDVVRHNITKFFSVIEEAWGLNNIKHVGAANQIKNTFLVTLAAVLSSHTNFWQGKKGELVVDKSTIKKLSTFDLNENSVVDLIRNSGGHKLNPILFQVIVYHINSGRRNGRLKSRFGLDVIPVDVCGVED